MEGEPEELYLLRGRFHAGNYKGAVEEAANVVADTEELQIYRDLLLLRSKIALGDARGVLKQLASTSKPALQAVKMLASISIASDSEKEALGRSVEDLVAAHGGESASLMLRIAAALCFLELGNVKAALRLARKEESLEELSLEVVGFLKIDRIDLAEKVLKKMKDADDDDACTQMASIWVALASSTSSNLSESTDTLNELAERYGGRTSLVRDSSVQRLMVSDSSAAWSCRDEEAGFCSCYEMFCGSSFSCNTYAEYSNVLTRIGIIKWRDSSCFCSSKLLGFHKAARRCQRSSLSRNECQDLIRIRVHSPVIFFLWHTPNCFRSV
jgi:hypothetical protein